jgi:serine/threonine-protein kinase
MPEIARDTMVDSRYRILSRVGSGGMADVYCAEDTQLGRRVALKLLYAHFAEDEQFVERFRREASSAAGLQHPNIVAVFDRGEWDGTYYIAMEYVEGRNLKQIVREHGPLDPADATEVVVQILKAARYAHRRGIVHRDIKPHNVIVDDEGRAKVTDFGIARSPARRRSTPTRPSPSRSCRCPSRPCRRRSATRPCRSRSTPSSCARWPRTPPRASRTRTSSSPPSPPP